MPLRRVKIQLFAAGAAVTFLAACQAAPPAPAPAPVVQPQYTPRAPTPPFRASATTIVPPLRADGLRQTINRDIGPLQTLWHVRSALNVAALSCTGPLYDRITDDYNAFIKNNSSSLRRANNAIKAKFRRENSDRKAHDRHMTSLYNYWSFSPIRRPFCDQAVQVSQRAIVTKSKDLNAFAAEALPELEKPFNNFYLAFEEYQRDLEAWNREYGQPQATQQ